MLRDLQRRILDGLLADEPPPEALDLLSRDRVLSPAQQLAVYRHSISATLRTALGEVYPVCRRLVGERFFAAAAATFVRRTTSRSPDLNDYGEDFALFLTGFRPASVLPYLPDVARLEWAWHRSLFGPEAEVIDMDALTTEAAELDPERVVFRLPRNAALIESAFPLHLIWEANQPGFQGDGVIDLARGGVRLLVWRREHARHIEPLAAPEWDLLHAVAEGLALGDVCLRVSSAHPSADLGRLLASALYPDGSPASRSPAD